MNVEIPAKFGIHLLACLSVFGFGVSPSCGAELLKKSKSPQSSWEETLDTRISQRAAKDGFMGTVLVVRSGDIVLHKTYGPLSTEQSEPAYWIASNSKQFTGALIATLANEGKVNLDSRIEEYLTGVPDEKRNITIRHLLTHSSGLGQQYAAEGLTDRNAAIAAILDVELVASPGERFSYSNDGFSLLAAIAEIVSGGSFDELMQSSIFRPAGLQQTGLWGFETEELIAPPFSEEAVKSVSDSIYVDGRSQSNWGYRGATGLFSTTEDLYRWAARVQNARIDDGDPLALIKSPEFLVRDDGTSTIYYGFGLAVVKRNGEFYMTSHIGDDDWLGHNSAVMAYADGDFIIVLSNSGYVNGNGWSSEVARDVQKILGK